MQALRMRIEALLQWVRTLTAYRVWSRYNQCNGAMLAAGIAYISFFTVFPVLALMFTAFGVFLGGRHDLRDKLITEINHGVGTTVIGLKPGEGLVSVDNLIGQDALTTTGIVAALVALYSGLSWVDSMRQSIQAVFGLQDQSNPILRKVRDLLIMLLIGATFIVSVGVSVALSTAADDILSALGINSAFAQFVAWLGVRVVLTIIDVGLFLMFFVLLARVKAPVRQLLPGALFGSVGLQLLTAAAPLVVRSASANRFLASVALVLVVLTWFNFFGRITLLASSVAATNLAENPQDSV